MANIYLRLPWYVCAYYRGLDENNQLGPFDPFEFKAYTHESCILQQNLRLIDESNQSALCYSERAWQNMLHGKAPSGGKPLLQRNPADWLDAKEVCFLTGKDMAPRFESFDYLCIAMPKEVVINNKIMKPNGSYALDNYTASDFSAMLRQEFVHVFLEWHEQDRRLCTVNNIRRTNLETVERFLNQFNIPISVDNHERETLRRMKNRWLAAALKRPNDRLQFQQGKEYLEAKPIE